MLNFCGAFEKMCIIRDTQNNFTMFMQYMFTFTANNIFFPKLKTLHINNLFRRYSYLCLLFLSHN